MEGEASEHSESGGSSGPSVSERSDKGTAPPPTKLSPGASLTIDDVAVEVRKTMAYMVLYQGKKDVRGLHRYVPVSAVGAPEKGDFGPKLGTHGSLLFVAEAIQKAIADEIKGARSGGGVSLDALADRIVPLKTADFLEAAKAYFPGKNHKDFETTTGFNEAGMVFIDVDKSTDVGTLIHEAVHLYAPNNFPDAFGNYLNEGTTEYFARQVITKLGLGLKRSKYEPEFVVASVLTSKVSEGVMKKAFLGGDIDALKGAVMGLSEEVESGSGEKRWKEFLEACEQKDGLQFFLDKAQLMTGEHATKISTYVQVQKAEKAIVDSLGGLKLMSEMEYVPQTEADNFTRAPWEKATAAHLGSSTSGTDPAFILATAAQELTAIQGYLSALRTNLNKKTKKDVKDIVSKLLIAARAATGPIDVTQAPYTGFMNSAVGAAMEQVKEEDKEGMGLNLWGD